MRRSDVRPSAPCRVPLMAISASLPSAVPMVSRGSARGQTSTFTGLDEAAERAVAFVDAGADVIFPEGMTSAADA